MRVLPLTLFCLGLPTICSALQLELLQINGDREQTVIDIGFAHRFQYVRHRDDGQGHVEIDLQLFDNVTANDHEQRHLPAVGLVDGDVNIELLTIDATRAVMRIELNKAYNIAIVPGRQNNNLTINITALASTTDKKLPDVPLPTDATVLIEPTPITTIGIDTASEETAPKIESTIEKTETTANLASQWLQKADAATAAKDWPQAIQALGELLKLPPNNLTEIAQEKIGDARAKAGDTKLAKIEYELFLKIYPQSAHAEIVKQKLTALQAPGEKSSIAAVVAPAAQHLYYGSLSQQYTSGNSKIDSTTDLGAGVVDHTSFTGDKQAMLISNLDFSYRYRSADYDARFVVRDTDLRDQSGNGQDRNRLNAAYFDVRAINDGWTARLGRQTQNSGGVFGRFDGLSATYLWHNWLKPQLIVGQLVDFGFEDKRKFYSLSTDVQKLTEHSDLNAWYTQQTAAGLNDRKAIGTQWRYQNNSSFASALFDYDTLFKSLNIVSVQSNWQTSGGHTYNMLLDYRRSPSLSTSNAVLGEATPSLQALRLIYSEKEIQQLALDKTATSKQIYAGASQPLNKSWQLGEDIRVFSISDTPGGGNLPAIVGTGNIFNYGLQLSGFNFPHDRASSFVQLSRQKGDQFSGSQLSLQYSARFAHSWQVECIARLSKQDDASGRQVRRFTPVLRFSWQFINAMALEAELMQEKSTTTTDTNEDISTFNYASIGYRWDF